MSSQRFHRVAVLNRGEAAVRFIRAARTWRRIRRTDLQVLALYTAPDAQALYVRMASASVALGPAMVPGPSGLRSAYLDAERMVGMARDAGADALWPGWGFLAENPELAERCVEAGLVFIGPSGDAMRLLGDKVAGKRLAEREGVPVAPWSGGLLPSPEEACACAERLGYPVLLKATAGGGGRGIRRVDGPDEMAAAFAAATAQAEAAFGDGGLLMEGFLPEARHVEVQVLADEHGTIWTLGTRDCSVQRRKQKVLEEAPAPDLSPALRERLASASRSIAQASGYVGAGTAEFLVEPGGESFAFMEMNTRLQVEHPVTERVYGVDLVVSQIDVAQGRPLPDKQPEPRGAAIEARLNAEDPDANFAPSVGRIDRFDVPQGPGIRVDSGVGAGDRVPAEFDSNLAKFIAWGATRDEAFARLVTGLRDCVVAIEGGPTNRSLLLELLSHPQIRDAAVTTRWLDRYLETRTPPAQRPLAGIALAAAAIGDQNVVRRGLLLNFHKEAQKGLVQRVPAIGATQLRYLVDGRPVPVSVSTRGSGRYRVRSGGELSLCARSSGARTFLMEDEATGARHHIMRIATPSLITIEVDGVLHRFTPTSDGRVLATIPAAVTQVHVRPGDAVRAGQRLLTLEVMKMETSVEAPLDGVIAEVCVDEASHVGAGDLLVTIEGQRQGDEPAPEPLELLPPASPSTPDPIDTLLQALLGYDYEDEEVSAAIDQLSSPVRPPRRAQLFELLEAAELQISLFQTGPYDDGRNAAGSSSAEQLGWYVRHPEIDPDHLSAPFLENLEAFLALHNIDGLRRTPQVELAVLRLFQAQHHPTLNERVLFGLLSALPRVPNDARSPDEETRRREILEHLANLVVRTNRRLAEAAWQTIHRVCDLPSYHLQARRQAAQAVYALADLVDPAVGIERRAQAREAMRSMPIGTLLEQLRLNAEAPLHHRETLLKAVIERIYEVRRVEPLADWALVTPALQITSIADATAVGICVGRPSELVGVLSAVPPDGDLDLVLGFSPDPEAITPYLAARSPGATANLIWGTSEQGLRLRSYRREADGVREVLLNRDLHPASPTAREVARFANFDCHRLSSEGGLFVALARARDVPSDERVIAVADVERITPTTDGEGVIRLPNFERTFLQALHAMREARRSHPEPTRLVWNRLTIVVRSALHLSRTEIERLAVRLWPSSWGLGLEKISVLARLDDREPSEMRAIEVSDPTGRGLVVRFAPPSTEPIRPLSEYERHVVDARRRSKLYPFELIRTLTSDAGGDSPVGTFAELDLDERGEALVPVDRPYGHHTANLVVGRITNDHPRFPAGLTRILIVGDPTRTMGSLGEPESRRVIAAIDTAEREGVPVEWVPISSGARISFQSGTENLDWTARVLRRIVTFTQAGGVINIIVDGTCVGAQSYWNAEATMLGHCRGTLVMTPSGAMLLTGRRALEYSGSVSARTNLGIGGLEAIMGPNGQAQYTAADLRDAYALLFRHYALTFTPSDYTVAQPTPDPITRDVCVTPYAGEEFATIGEIFSDETNPGRKRPFAIRHVMRAVVDSDVPPIERWATWENAQTTVVMHAQLGGQPVCLIGIESMPIKRRGALPPDGPDTFSSGTLFPQSSRKVSRAINAVSGVCPVVVLANLSGFDGSPESMRLWQLEYGAEIGRAVVNFQGPVVFCVIARYHGGAYVVFSQALNDRLKSVALEGTYASVIGGGPAAAVVFPGMVRRRTRADARVKAAAEIRDASGGNVADKQARFQATYREVEAEVQATVAREFDGVHTVERALEVGSLTALIGPQELRPWLCAQVQRELAEFRGEAAGSGDSSGCGE